MQSPQLSTIPGSKRFNDFSIKKTDILLELSYRKQGTERQSKLHFQVSGRQINSFIGKHQKQNNFIKCSQTQGKSGKQKDKLTEYEKQVPFTTCQYVVFSYLRL